MGISFLIAASGFSVDSIADTLLTQIQQLNVDAGWLKAMDSQTCEWSLIELSFFFKTILNTIALVSDSMPREGSAGVLI